MICENSLIIIVEILRFLLSVASSMDKIRRKHFILNWNVRPVNFE